MMTLSDRLQANALIDRLIDDATDRFAAADAEALIALVPVSKKPSMIALEGAIAGGKDRTAGRAAGVGDVELEEDRKERRFSLGTGDAERVGGYKVRHAPGALEIEALFTTPDNPQTCLLVYGKKGMRLDLLHPRLFELPFGLGQVGYSVFRPWKRPA